MTDAQLYFAILSLPPDLKKQVADFIDYLKSKSVHPRLQKRQIGCAKGLIRMSPDFDEPLEEFKEYV